MSRGWWGDPLTSEDLHSSPVFKIWLVHHKNKFLPLSLLCAEDLDRSTYPGKSNPSPRPTQPHSAPISGTAPMGASPLAVKLSLCSGNISNHLLSKHNRANNPEGQIASLLETCYQRSAIWSPSERQGARSPPQLTR